MLPGSSLVNMNTQVQVFAGLILIHLTCFPACWGVSGPGNVSGTLRRTLTVDCRYGKEYQDHLKYWCRGSSPRYCNILVMTDSSHTMVKKDRVAIKDDKKSCSFQITMKDVNLEDAGIYWCGIEFLGLDLMAMVTVYVLPELPTTAPPTTPQPKTAKIEHTLSTFRFTISPGQDEVKPSTEDLAISNTSKFISMSNVHFLILVFLKIPLVLMLLFSVICVRWVTRGWTRCPSHCAVN
ncbi:CMRF35-like molecule 5 [Ambystoma mexicanum]|uniref:CMRF35-like molecule 5 n=1 Tax=Ambystoma mexicanum TaxID=8296 RepID=UPI0037E8B28F